MRTRSQWVIFAGALALVLAAAPVRVSAQNGNDTCAQAMPINIGGTSMDATDGETRTGPYPTCDGVAHTAPEVWFTVGGDGNTLTADTCNSADYDTQITVYCADCDPGSITCVAGNDDKEPGCGSGTSEVSWCSRAGATYYVMVHGADAQTGFFDLSITSDDTPCTGAVQCIPSSPAPTLSTWGLAAAIATLLTFGLLALRRRSRV